MFYHPDWIVPLWLTPVFIMFILPVLFVSSIRFFDALIRMNRKAEAAKARMSRVAAQPVGPFQSFDKRKHPRMKVDGVVAHISDGKSYCEGFVHDISQFGICLNNHPDKLDRKVGRLGVLLIGHGKYFQVQVQPKWETGDGVEDKVGAVIEDTCWDWDEFKENMESMKQHAHAQA